MTKFLIILCLFISAEAYTFILIDWKKDTSSGSEEGHVLSKVKIIIDDNTIFEEAGEFTSGKFSFSNIKITTGFDPNGI
tara:strand:- start:248 stop:484 length:237 start_codon:yes stop_codon:yes gene_type:complete